MQKKALQPARFAILFLLTLGATSIAIFFIFSTYQRKMAALRRDESRAKLETIHLAIGAYAKKNGGDLPDHAARLPGEYIPAESTLINDTWPEQAGYIYIPGVKPGDPLDTFILVYENVPERKRKLGIQVLLLDGRIETLTEREFTARLDAQESAWKKSGRVWAPEALVPRDP